MRKARRGSVARRALVLAVRLEGRALVMLASLLICARAAALDGDVALPAFERVEAMPLTERILVVHVVDGHVIYAAKGQKRDQDRLAIKPLDVAAASDAAHWTVRGDGLAGDAHPERVGRKTKGAGFAWRVEGWDGKANRAKNTHPDHVSEHWLYLVLPAAMRVGSEYVVGSTVDGIAEQRVRFDPATARSEAVHVDLLGMTPDSPAKFAYVSHWAGDLGGVDLGFLAGRRFRLIDQRTHREAFVGAVARRGGADQAETAQLGDTPHGNFSAAETWECDFSAFAEPGTYVVAVDGVGCSFPLRIDADAYREAYRATARALYHNRSGIALTEPFTEFERPAPHHPGVTPGFAGKLVYTTSRCCDWANGDHDDADKPAIQAGIKGPLDAWGWYQDAGDWDSYPVHSNVASCLLFAYECAPRAFRDNDLGIPESGNGVPDVLDEAAWLPRFCHRLRHELMTKGWGDGGVGLRVCGDHFGGDGDGIGSWQDVERTWIVSGQDPFSTMRYAAIAAHLALALKQAGVADPEKIDWTTEAREAYAWAEAHLSADDATKSDPRAQRAYAAAALFRLTGDRAYERRLADDTAQLKPDDELAWDAAYGAWAYLLGDAAATRDAALAERLRAIALRSCEKLALESTARRALRWGGTFSMPMLVGQQTTPWILDGIVGEALTRASDPAEARAFRAAVHTTADYFLGGNPLNLVWMTGVGPRHVQQVFHLDAWQNGKGVPQPGVVPYGPWRKGKDLGMGPWDQEWANESVHPAIDAWPGAERWFENRCAPMNSEFTIHQTVCYAAAVYGWLCGER